MNAHRSASPSWDVAQYLRFSGERLRPALDLLQRIPDALVPRRVIDLGCGTGEITLALKRRWPQAEVTGLDSAASMLERARSLGGEVEWIRMDIAKWSPGRPFDLIYSNAALHWLDAHEILFPRLLHRLATGGVLAVQMPRNFGAPSHRLMREVAEEAPWRERLRPALRPEPVLPAERYYDLLAPIGSEVDLWESEYIHVLEGETPVLDWVKGTGLRPLLDLLTDQAERAEFIDRYQAKLAQTYPRRADGRTLFPFKRFFLIARR
ncbi:MAG TPA: methyltransferase domain-containing protein [Alphaproteobacteria bacterium]|nr:methyltransferase domain-containing protein [Alphaproteobacteria bacterium]